MAESPDNSLPPAAATASAPVAPKPPAPLAASALPPREVDPLAITEAPLPLVDGQAAGTPLEAAEAVVSGLIKRVGELEFAGQQAATAHKNVTRDILLSVMEVMDAFERVFRSIEAKRDQVTPQMNKWMANFRTIQRMLNRLLEDQGVAPIQNLEQGFDPRWHKVADIIVDPGRPEGTIAEEARRGYVWHGEVLRKAEVVVIRHRDDGPAEE